jgi:hypothetical protein
MDWLPWVGIGVAVVAFAVFSRFIAMYSLWVGCPVTRYSLSAFVVTEQLPTVVVRRFCGRVSR